MGFSVLITTPARQDIHAYVQYIRREHRSDAGAKKWAQGLRAKIKSLKDLADKFNPIPEGPIDGVIHRSFQYCSHRVIYRIDEANQTVLVVCIYHGSRRDLKAGDL